MKYQVTRFKSLQEALKQLEPFIRDGQHLETGRPFTKLGGMRSREALANLLVCICANADAGDEHLTFTSDPTGGDGILLDAKSNETWPTEHVMVSRLEEVIDGVKALVIEKVTSKQQKGGPAYAKGKILIVFVNSAGGAWNPNAVAKALQQTDFLEIWAVGLQSHEGGYVYGVTRLQPFDEAAQAWIVRVAPGFDSWKTERIQ